MAGACYDEGAERLGPACLSLADRRRTGEGKLTAAEVVRILQRGGWQVVRQRGSHQRLEHPARPQHAVTVAFHSSRDVPEGTLRAILRRAGLSREEFEALRRR